jgi:hypothetical protein
VKRRCWIKGVAGNSKLLARGCAIGPVQKRKGAPTSPWEVPRRPKFHQPGCGFEPVRAYNDPKAELFPARELFLWQKKKAPAPPGASHNKDTRAALRLPGERVLSVPLKLDLKIRKRAVGFRTQRRFVRNSVAVLPSPRDRDLARYEKCCPQGRGQQSG